MRIIRAGDGGDDVRDVQQRLLALQASIDADELDGRFGPSTEVAVRAFQAERRLPVDGLVGPDTWSQLVEAGYELGDRALYLRYPFLRGDDVRALQRRLNALGFDAGREDGILGRETDGAIRDFQRNVGQVADGIVGPDTVAALGRLRPDITATSRAVVREAEELRVPRGTIVGAVIAIDPGHGGTDEGVVGPSGMSESRATLAIARALGRRLSEGGAVPLLLRGRTTTRRPATAPRQPMTPTPPPASRSTSAARGRRSRERPARSSGPRRPTPPRDNDSPSSSSSGSATGSG